MDYETYLEQYGTMTHTNVGVSMLPLLRQRRDLFTVRKKGPERCRRGDVALYRRPPNQYVLHRIIAVRDIDYVVLGDNCLNKEYGITDADIIGVMTGFTRDGKEYTVSHPGYRIYSWVWMTFHPVRRLWMRVKNRARRVKQRLFREKTNKGE